MGPAITGRLSGSPRNKIASDVLNNNQITDYLNRVVQPQLSSIKGVQRADVREVRPADAIDPLYGRTLREALAAGVEVLAYGARVTTRDIRLERRLAVHCPAAPGIGKVSRPRRGGPTASTLS